MLVPEGNTASWPAFSEVGPVLSAGRGAAQRGWGPTGCRSFAAAGFCPVPACAVPVIFDVFRVFDLICPNKLSNFRSKPVFNVTRVARGLYLFINLLFTSVLGDLCPTSITVDSDNLTDCPRPLLRQMEQKRTQFRQLEQIP